VSLLVVERLGKSFAGRPLFSEVSLQLGAGEALAIVGPSGSGKTTLLRCLDGLERADAGSISVGGRRLEASDPPQRFAAAGRVIRQSVGMVFQGCHLFSHRTVLENVMEGPLYVQRAAPLAVRRQASELLETVGIAHRASALPRELSGGEQQRAAIARALAMRPELLLLDEPTSALDLARAESLAALLAGLVRGGLSLVAVTHDLAFARALATRRLRMDAGGLVDFPGN
jgi:ABC-type polar amino acid transport system ATPase subunit